MERRSWPWKRKSSEKASTDSDSIRASLSSIGAKQGDQELAKPVSFVQISVEKYEHYDRLEEQVLILNENLTDMKKRLSSAQADMITKDDMVKQHAKVAEEAISGWEKTEAENLALKHQLESATLLKLASEERAVHLDNALKECMKQIHNVKEEAERKLHDVVFAKTKLWEKVKCELEATIAGLEQEFLKNSAETAALSRSLQDRSILLVKISEEKAQADAEIEVLKTNIQSYVREINSLKYELNIAAQELEIRNEEKNMSVKAAEVANKQQSDGVKKIANLEAECQRLRGLVRKRLPGPAALAQMKLETETLGNGFGETRARRQSVKSSGSYPFLSREANANEVEHCLKENEFLTSRLLAMEEETKMLKEALSKRNSELQHSASTCAKTANKLHVLEGQILVMNKQKKSLKSNADFSFEGSMSQNESSRSLALMSDDGVDDGGSNAGSWTSALVSDLSQYKKEKNSIRSKTAQSPNQIELMDDFLEMERLAGLSSENNVLATVSVEGVEKMDANCDDTSSVDVYMDVCKEQASSLKENPNFNLVTEDHQPSGKSFSMLQARIASAVESKAIESEARNLVEEIMTIIQDAQNELFIQSKNLLNVVAPESIDAKSCQEIENSMKQDLRSAISWIQDFVLLLYKDAAPGKASELQVTKEELEEFSDSVKKVFSNNLNSDDFILSLCHVLSEIKELRSRACVSPQVLEHEEAHPDSTEGKVSADYDLSLLASEIEVVKKLNKPTTESEAAAPQSFSFEEFKILKIEKDSMEADLLNCKENLKHAQLQLTETGHNLTELKQLLSVCQNSNDLAGTQLRCMTESYKLLETRGTELEAEINLLRSKVEVLECELSAERHSHQDYLAKYDSLQEQMRIMSLSKCSCFSEADEDSKARQEREIAAAADKLTACQEAIYLLNKQINALQAPVEEKSKSCRFSEEHSPESDMVSRSTSEAVNVSPPSHYSISDVESSPAAKLTASTKHRSRSTSASSLLGMLNDRPAGHGFSRFFAKEKNEI